MKALIVGGGIAGLATAVVLSRDGIDVTIAERRDQLEALGSGITLTGPAVRALGAIGVLEDCLADGFGTTEFRFCGVDGELLQVVPLPPVAGPPWPGMMGLMRPKLHAILAAAAQDAGTQVRTATTVVGLQTDAGGARVELADGTSHSYDLVVGAYGVSSWVRGLLFADGGARFERTGCWRAVLPRPAEVDAEYVFEGHHTAHPGFTPIGEDLMYMFCVAPATESWRPAPDDAPAIMRGLLADFGGLAAQARERIVAPDRIDYRPLYSLLAPAPWHTGRVVLVGDAAHTATPHLAAGGAMALEDAVVLGETLRQASGDVLGALEEFTERRFDRCRLVVETSSTLNRWQLHPDEPGADRAALSANAFEALALPY
jgi:2-polyprenyl-6-methoxyphenol hydroxylase-like FAD-dependent oxidoreductase